MFHTNEYQRRVWIAEPLNKKGNGHSIHVSDFVTECQQILTKEEQQVNLAQVGTGRVIKTNAQVIIHPGKGHDAWWDGLQLASQLKHMIDIFEFKYPDCIGVWIFDCS